MIHPEAITWSVEFNTRALSRNLEGLTHEDSLVQPLGGNCINWNVGHIIANRNAMLELLGADRVWDLAAEERYRRGSGPIRGEQDAPERLEKLRQVLEETQERLLNALEATDPRKLEEPSGKTTVGRRLNFLGLHEAYHVGQVGLLRRIVGKEGAIP